MIFFNNPERLYAIIQVSCVYPVLNLKKIHTPTHTFMWFSRILLFPSLKFEFVFQTNQKDSLTRYTFMRFSKSWIWIKSERLTHTFMRISPFLWLSTLYLNMNVLDSNWDLTIWKILISSHTYSCSLLFNFDSKQMIFR